MVASSLEALLGFIFTRHQQMLSWLKGLSLVSRRTCKSWLMVGVMNLPNEFPILTIQKMSNRLSLDKDSGNLNPG